MIANIRIAENICPYVGRVGPCQLSREMVQLICTKGRINEYPSMHCFGIPRQTQSTISYRILTEYFWKFQWKITLWECCKHSLFRDRHNSYNCLILRVKRTEKKFHAVSGAGCQVCNLILAPGLGRVNNRSGKTPSCFQLSLFKEICKLAAL